MPRPLTIITIKPKQKESEVKNFIHEGLSQLVAAKHLFGCNDAHLAYINPAIVLCHHGLELMLKASLIWDDCKYPWIHDLLSLAEDISFIKLNREHRDQLSEINTYCDYRYPLDYKRYEAIRKTLERVDSGEEPGLPNLPGENEINAWDGVYGFYQFLVESMPKEMAVLHKEVRQQLRIKAL